jgi:hypothetical protein
MAVTILIPSRSAGIPGGGLWLTNPGEQISSTRSMLPALWTSSTKRRTRALLSSAGTASSPFAWVGELPVGDMMPPADTQREVRRGDVIRIAAPLTVTSDEIDEGVSIIDQALTECGK